MINYLWLLIIVFTTSIQNIFNKEYDKKEKIYSLMFSGLVSFTAMLFFIVSGLFSEKSLHFTLDFIPYSIGFAVVYGVATIFTLLSIKTGSLAKTTLIVSYSLLIPTLYGIIFLHEPVKPTTYIGIILLAVSLFLVNYQKTHEKLSFKWLIFVLLAFCGNGMCSVFQTMQQKRFNGEYKSELMIVALFMISLAFFIIAAFTYKKEFFTSVKNASFYAALCGICNGITNLLFLVIINSSLNLSILFPVIAAGGMIVLYLFSVFLYKEKFTVRQRIGYAVGVVTIVLLNL